MAAVWAGGRKLVRYAPSRAEARRLLRELVVRQAAGRLSAPSRLTLTEWVERWLSLVEPDRRPSTLRTYRQVLAPVLARVGHVKLHRLTPAALALTLAALRREGVHGRPMGTRRLELAYATLRTCLGAAVALGELAENPLRQVPRPKHTPARRALWTQAELGRFVQAAVSSQYRYAPLLLLLLGGGLRLSEALALTWEDLDLERGSVQVTKALVWAGSHATTCPPKTRSGARTVTLPRVVVEALRGLPRPLGGGPLFVTSGGRPPGQNVLRATMQRLCREAGVPVLRLHDLRHLHASLLLSEGVAVPEVAARLGHSTPAVTMQVYAHRLRGSGGDDPAVRAAERWLGGPGREQR